MFIGSLRTVTRRRGRSRPQTDVGQADATVHGSVVPEGRAGRVGVHCRQGALVDVRVRQSHLSPRHLIIRYERNLRRPFYC